MIFYLAYHSFATDSFTKSDFSDILSTSRFHNKLKDITGILLYHEGNILQLLEGDEDSVIKLFNKIKLDSRHNNITKIISGISTAHNFPDWPMSFKNLTACEWNEYANHLRSNSLTLLRKLKNTNLDVDTMVNSFVTSFNLNSIPVFA